MQSRVVAFGVMLGVLLATAVAAQDAAFPPADSAYSSAFAASFGDACYAHRTSFDEMKSSALASGWTEAGGTDNTKLRNLLNQTEALRARTDIPGWKLDYVVYSRQIAGQPHFLIANSASSTISPPVVGCYIYNFEAEAPVDGTVIASALHLNAGQEQQEMGALFHIWTVSEPEGQVMLVFIPADTEAAAQTNSTGVIMNINTFLSE